MKYFFRLLIVFSIFTGGVVCKTGPAFANMQELEFLTTIPDLPLMPALRELDDQAVIYDKPNGRIVEIYLSLGTLSIKDVQTYYQNMLPQLGWVLAGPQTYVRDSERLLMSFEQQNQSYLHFKLMPR